MCEYKVYVRDETGTEEMVGEDIVVARIDGGIVVLKDVMGFEKRLEDAIIREVNVNNETITLERSGLISPFMEFLEAYRKYRQGGGIEEAKSAWKKLLEAGNKMFSNV